MKKPKKLVPIEAKRQQIARRFGNFVVELDGAEKSICVRRGGHRIRHHFSAADLHRIESLGSQLHITTDRTVMVRDRKRPLVVCIDFATGHVAVFAKGVTRGMKTYNLADLFTWGEQLQLL